MNLRNKSVDFWLLMTIFMLLGLGTMMVFSSSSAASYSKFQDSYYFLINQLRWVGLGLLVMGIVTFVDYHFIGRFSIPIFLISLALLVAVLIPGIGRTINNARRWIYIGGVSFQPSELMKLGIVLLFAYLLAHEKYAKKMKSLIGFLVMLVILGVVAFLLYEEPHVSCIIIIVLVSFILMFIGGIKLRYFVVLGGIGAAGVVFAFSTLNHVRERVLTFLNPFAYASDEGYQIVQSLLAIGSGGFFGKGLGQSIQKYNYLPEPYNDFILSIAAEELGFVGIAVILALFAVFIWRGYKIAINAPDRYGTLVAAGITSIIAVQTVMNVAVVTSSMPVTGVALPFFSYGGTSTVFLMINMGILLNISKQSDYDKF